MTSKKRKRAQQQPHFSAAKETLMKGEETYQSLQAARRRITFHLNTGHMIQNLDVRRDFFAALHERRRLVSGELSLAEYGLKLRRLREAGFTDAFPEKFRKPILRESFLMIRLRAINAELVTEASMQGMDICELLATYADEEMELLWLVWPDDDEVPVWEHPIEVEGTNIEDEAALQMLEAQVALDVYPERDEEMTRSGPSGEWEAQSDYYAAMEVEMGSDDEQEIETGEDASKERKKRKTIALVPSTTDRDDHDMEEGEISDEGTSTIKRAPKPNAEDHNDRSTSPVKKEEETYAESLLHSSETVRKEDRETSVKIEHLKEEEVYNPRSLYVAQAAYKDEHKTSSLKTEPKKEEEVYTLSTLAKQWSQAIPNKEHRPSSFKVEYRN